MKCNCTDLNSFFGEICAAYSEKSCLCDVNGDSFSYGQVFDKVVTLAAILRSKGIQPRDRIAIVAANSPHWVIAYFAIIRLDCVAVPILTDFCDQDIANILVETEARAVFTCKHNAKRLFFAGLDDLLVLSLHLKHSGCENDIIKKNGLKGKEDQKTQKSKQLYLPGQTASIIYTSGTSGYSKGVLLTHENLLANLESARQLINIKFHWRFLSVLPLSHAYEFTIGLLLPLLHGASIYYLKKRPTPKVLADACAIVRPDVLCMVPLLLEKIYKKKVQPVLTENVICSVLIKIPFLKVLLFKVLGSKILRFFGGNIQLFAIGGAALHINTEKFLKMSGLPYLVGYGLTEASPLIAGGPFRDASIALGSVGKIIPNVEVRLAGVNQRSGIGEIQARGANIMNGYFDNDQLTKETITSDGWLKTGDLGLFDHSNNLVITGRLKNVIVLSSGENVYPEELEDKLLSFLAVAEALVIEKKGRLEAIIVPDYEYLAEKHGVDIEKIKKGGAQLVINEIDSIRRAVNATLPSYAKIYFVCEHPQNLTKTPTHKVKRYLYVEN